MKGGRESAPTHTQWYALVARCKRLCFYLYAVTAVVLTYRDAVLALERLSGMVSTAMSVTNFFVAVGSFWIVFGLVWWL